MKQDKTRLMKDIRNAKHLSDKDKTDIIDTILDKINDDKKGKGK